MRFLFKTDYNDDIRLVPHSGYLWSYGALLILLVIAPFTLSSYLMSQLVFVCIYATVGVGLMILTGFTGQASLGHAAFLAIGDNGLRTPQNGVVSFDFADLAVFNGLTTAAGYAFNSQLTADTEVYRISFAVVPEPATLGLLALGGIGMAAIGRRRNN